MPRRPSSGYPGLFKSHNAGCAKSGDYTKCECPWRGKYRGNIISLAVWSKQTVDPRTKGTAIAVMKRFVNAVDGVDGAVFDKSGERPVIKGGMRLKEFITDEWKPNAEKYNRSENYIDSADVIAAGLLGNLTLDQLAGSPKTIADWLDAQAKDRDWKDKTWNNYRDLIYAVCQLACEQKVNHKPRMASNPVTQVARKVVEDLELFKEVRVTEPLEDKLLAACDKLNRVQHRPHGGSKLTQAKADAIRVAVEGGTPQVEIAKAFAVSASVVCEIVKGGIWNPSKLVVGTKGSEMRRRLYAIIDMGVRTSEMLLIQVKHVNWNQPVSCQAADGTKFDGYVITMPPRMSKGGKTTGKIERLFIGTQRLAQEVERRRFLGKDAFLFGTEGGQQVKGFRRMWNELFELAGLEPGRDQGMVWHTLRHEFISRLAETTKDPVLAQQLARHKDLKTTMKYFHVGNDAKWAAAVGLNRR